MTSRDRDRFRKYESESSKRARQQQRDDFIKKQTVSFDKYLSRPTTSQENSASVVPKTNNEYVNIISNSSKNIYEQKSPLISETDHVIQNNVSKSLVIDDSVETLSSTISYNKQSTAVQYLSNSTIESPVVITDLTDPGNWPIHLTHDVRIDIVKNGPCRVDNFNYPIDSEQRKFSDYYYTRRLSNGEVVNRYWLIYSKKKNCCAPSAPTFNIAIDFENESSCSEIKEYFMDFIHISSTTGMDLSNILIEKLKEYGLSIHNIRGQAYDNGENMAGLYKGVKAHILKQNPRAFFVPCAAHSLNLCLKDAGGSSSTAQLFFGMIERIYLSIKKWTETRWNSRVNAVKAIRFQLNEVAEALEEISDTTNDLKIKNESHSLAKEICSYEFILSLIIWYDILSEINIVSMSLQSVTIDLDVSMSLLNGLIIFLENYRENEFELAKVKAEEIRSPMRIELKFKKNRIRKKTKMFHYEGMDYFLTNEEENFRVKYFLVLVDQTLASVKKRFEQITQYNEKFGFLYRIGQLKNMGEELFKHCQDLQITLIDVKTERVEESVWCSSFCLEMKFSCVLFTQFKSGKHILWFIESPSTIQREQEKYQA
ncbi:hypothetical protein QTP88_027958 [Uroleucon formosanum]